MNERQKRLIEVYEHLRRYYGIHTKTGFAESLHYGRTSLSAAMNGDESYLTDNLFKNICDAYKGVFNLEYLLTGKGVLLTIEEEVHNEDLEKLSQTIDQSSLVNAALAAKDQVIAQMELRLSEKDEIIQTQRLLIQNLQQQLAELRATSTNYDKHPFPMGVADKPDMKPERV